MESILPLIIPAFLGVLTLRLLLYPIGWTLRLGIHAAGGFGCLWLLNTVSGFTGLLLPVNSITVLLSGLLGIPGIVIVAALELLG